MSETIAVTVPDIGDFSDVPVIEVLVKPGDSVKPEDPLITLESNKSTMDVPAPAAGTVEEVKVRVGDKVAKGTLILMLATSASQDAGTEVKAEQKPQQAEPSAAPAEKAEALPAAPPPAAGATPAAADSDRGPPASVQAAPTAGVRATDVDARTDQGFVNAHASPLVRKFARELGVDLSRLTGSGPKGRILEQDVRAYVKRELTQPPATSPAATGVGGIDLLPWPKVDFAKFGPVEIKPLSRIKKISGANLHRNWVMIPHVTNHDEADITELEAFRVKLNKEIEKSGVKVSMLAFMIKAACTTLKKFPEFNASLDGDNLVLKNFYHIGFAADTPNGLVVPVIRDADKKGVVEIAKDMGDLAKLARDGKLKPDQMQGGTFTISSLGGIGGTYFTPIINAPEVAIMGVCKSFWKQVSADGKTSAWQLTLPLSLSWDHRVIDGAAAARFNGHFANLLADMRRSLV